ncbi:transposase [Rhizobium lemnae]|uniref:Transposase n=1 Tax=Rhizobium lemnae TaxID=1214924 RepID=A0ABV8EEA4_9HYPH|nr:transposase [Rhizobium lemnae]MCJ8508662.1 transposase [Rhizobium lemnae]
MEILTGVERRRDWSDDEKLSILQEAAEPDARIADVARRHDIKPQQIYTWRRKFAAEQAEPVVSCMPPPKAVCRDLLIGFKSMAYVMRYDHFAH